MRLGVGAAFAAPGLAARAALGMDRVAPGGRLRLSVPLALSNFDPHDAASLDAAVFGSALFDTLYALDDQGRPYPTLAKSLPETSARGVTIELREGLRTAADKPFDVKDATFSVERARAGAAARLLAGFDAIRFAAAAKNAKGREPPKGAGEDVVRLATALAHPATALVPRGFSPARPDGTGAFRARPAGDGVVLERNPRAARGPAFLESIGVRRAVDLAGALRAFEAGEADVGWLSSGLHQARTKAKRFDAGPIGLVLLATGQQLGTWSAPGVAQSVLDSGDRSALAALGVHALPGAASARASGAGWQGPSADVLVDADATQLVAIARALVEILGGERRGLRVVPTAPAEIARVRRSGDFALLVDFVRSTGARDHLRAVLTRAGATASDGEPLGGVTRRLRLGVVGQLHVEGASLTNHGGVASWNLGDVHVVPAR